MADLATIRAALAANLGTLADAPEELQVSPYMLSDPTPPCLWVFPEEVVYDAAMARGLDRLMLTVQALVGFTTDQGSQERLDVMLAGSGTGSVKTALESDKNLGGAAQSLRVVRCSGYRIYELGARRFLGAEWSVEVIATG